MIRARCEMPDHAGILGLPSGHIERRARANSFVHEILTSCGLSPSAVRGSWRHGDFHLKQETDISFSDLDLVVDAPHEQRTCLQEEISHCLASTLPLKVAIHPVESMSGLAIEDSRLLLAGEYIISMAWKVPAGLMSADYVRAKVALLFLRERTTERYLEVSMRMGGHVTSAASVKLGIKDAFTVDDMAICLSATSDPNTLRFVECCLRSSPDVGFICDWKAAVLNAPSIHPWLKDFIVARVNQTLRL